jgi:hypothetical protein
MELTLDKKEFWKIINDNSLTSAEIVTAITYTIAETPKLLRKRKKATVLIISTILSRVVVYVRGEKDPSMTWMTLKDRYALRT